MNKQILTRYSLKFNPFSQAVPTQALYVSPPMENFFWRIENALIREGGFALICGEPGTGKSAALRVLAERLGQLRDVQIATIVHPSSSMADFYREMGDVFALDLRPSNRWRGFKQLRQCWQTHLESALIRPVLIIDEVQEMPPMVLNELRLLSSSEYDSKNLLSVVMAGDGRLLNKLRREELLPLASRIRTRLVTEQADREALGACLRHLIEVAGNPALISDELIDILCDHAGGNHRALIIMAAELFAAAVREKIDVLDEQLFLSVFGAEQKRRRRRA